MLSKGDLRQREITYFSSHVSHISADLCYTLNCVILTLQLLSLFVFLMDSFIVHVLTCNSSIGKNVSSVSVN